MACFSLGYLAQLLVYLVVVFGLIAIVRLLLPLLASALEPILGSIAGTIVQILNIIILCVIAIIVIYLVFGFIQCMLGAGGGMGSLLPPGPHR